MLFLGLGAEKFCCEGVDVGFGQRCINLGGAVRVEQVFQSREFDGIGFGFGNGAIRRLRATGSLQYVVNEPDVSGC